MPISRRLLLGALGLGALAPGCAAPHAAPLPDLQDWDVVRAQFALDPELVHLGLFFLASHPRPVADAVARWRAALDANPAEVVDRALFGPDARTNLGLAACEAVASYIGGHPGEVALVQNTTTALAVLYHGFPLAPGDEVLTTTHDHYVHHEAIRLATARAGATWRKVPLFDATDAITATGVADRVRAAIRPETRVLGVTWVHSSTGVRLPIRAIADALAGVNAGREPGRRVLLVVDAVHGLGVEAPGLVALGADAVAAGLHKWMFAPRGTGFAWARAEVWATMRPLLPTFSSFEPYRAWMAGEAPAGPPVASWFSPGGFQAYEHYWAVPEAIAFHRAIGPDRITARIHALNQQLGDGLRELPHVRVHTPRSPELNTGMVCFDVDGLEPAEVVAALRARGIVGSETPYRPSSARLSCGIANTEDEVERALAAIRGLA